MWEKKNGTCTAVCLKEVVFLIAELQWPQGPPSGAPYPYRKEKETDELIFSWIS